MDFRWVSSQKSRSKGPSSEVLVVHLFQTSKTSDTLILLNISDNCQPVTQPMGGANNNKFSLIEVGIGLISG